MEEEKETSSHQENQGTSEKVEFVSNDDKTKNSADNGPSQEEL